MSDERSSDGYRKPHAGNATRNLSLLFCLGMLAGVLIWAKLRLVTDIPRSAYADPREGHVVESDENPEGFDHESDERESEQDSDALPAHP